MGNIFTYTHMIFIYLFKQEVLLHYPVKGLFPYLNVTRKDSCCINGDSSFSEDPISCWGI